jgi:hypothetical protein
VCGLAAAGGFACSSGDDGSGGSGGSGGSAPFKNVYVNQVRSAACLPRPIATDETGHVPCNLVEARSRSSATCACDATQGRSPVTDPTNVVRSVEEYIRNVGMCGAQGTPACSDYCYCELQQFVGSELLACEGSLTDPGTQYGFCYVDPMIDSNGDGTADANPALLAECKDTEKRKLRFLGPGVPASDALVFLTCEGASATD